MNHDIDPAWFYAWAHEYLRKYHRGRFVAYMHSRDPHVRNFMDIIEDIAGVDLNGLTYNQVACILMEVVKPKGEATE